MASDSEDDTELEIKVKNDPYYFHPWGKFHEDLDYIRDNLDREEGGNEDLFYKKKTAGCNVSKWNRDDPDAGDTVEYGIADVEAHESITETRAQLGKIRWGKVANKNQIGANLEYVGAKAEAKIGLVDVAATALEGSYTAALGRNTGIMVREQIIGANARLGPVNATIGVGCDTGVRVGADGIEVKGLGTGISADGQSIEVSFIGSKVKFPAPWTWF